jgi:hypothetical protein
LFCFVFCFPFLNSFILQSHLILYFYASISSLYVSISISLFYRHPYVCGLLPSLDRKDAFFPIRLIFPPPGEFPLQDESPNL